MKITIDTKFLDEQIALCERYEMNGKNTHERNLFSGIANLLTEISVAATTDKVVEIYGIYVEEE